MTMMEQDSGAQIEKGFDCQSQERRLDPEYSWGQGPQKGDWSGSGAGEYPGELMMDSAQKVSCRGAGSVYREGTPFPGLHEFMLMSLVVAPASSVL